MDAFEKFTKKVNAKFIEMSKGELFVVGSDNRELERVYLDSFPEGTNPVFKTVTEHDCSCCKNFIRNIGNVVAFDGDKMITVWGIPGLEFPYDIVAKKMDEFVLMQPVTSVFRSEEPQYGAEQSRQLREGGSVKTWNHFYGKLAAKHFVKGQAATQIGAINSARQVFERGLKEIPVSVLDDILGLINQDSLYRGSEHRALITEFRKLKIAYEKSLTWNDFIWKNCSNFASGFRNTVIGTLAQDLSEGKPLEAAVAAFEAKVAPTNYKRTTSLITPGMVKAAQAKLQELGLEEAILRRHANISDITPNNVLWVNGATKSKMKGSVMDQLLSDTVSSRKSVVKDAVKIGIDEFMTKVIPTATAMELKVKNNHQSNFVTLTAPQFTNAGRLFKWDNDFAWSYSGNITDSIKERVKTAGGNVTNAALRVSLAWFNHDDLDLHCVDPSGFHHYFASRYNRDCYLDVDMNAGGGTTKTPVENISFPDGKVKDGKYKFHVNQYSKRSSSDVGFEIEIECNGILNNFSHVMPVQSQKSVNFELSVKDGKIAKITTPDSMVGGSKSTEKWGISTEEFVPVETLMFSPNYWDDNAIGNKHWFFILKGCKTDEPTRGIYNEFLRGEFEPHRKTFEILGEKTKCSISDDQLSGVGFSSTKRDSVTVSVSTNNTERIYEVNF